MKDGYADDTEEDGRTRIKKRKGEIGFTLSTGKISADNQLNVVKDKFHAGSMKNLKSKIKIRVHPPRPCRSRIYLSSQSIYNQTIMVKLLLMDG